MPLISLCIIHAPPDAPQPTAERENGRSAEGSWAHKRDLCTLCTSLYITFLFLVMFTEQQGQKYDRFVNCKYKSDVQCWGVTKYAYLEQSF